MKAAIIASLLVLVAGCTQGPPAPFDQMGGPTNTPSLEDIKEEFSTNGEMIYHTGYNQDGQGIPIEGGPGWIYMRGGACVTCHGADGKAADVPHMCSVEAASISYHDLTEEEHEEHGEEEEEAHPPYTDDTIKRAIKEGLNPAGEKLDPCMPQWEMSDEDMGDLIEYLKTLQ